MGFLHSTKAVQNKPHPFFHLSLLPSLFIWLLDTICPQWSSKTHVNDVFNKNRHQHNNSVSTVPKKDIVILLPYSGLQSNQAAKRLKKCVYKFYSCVNLKIVFQSTRCIRSFFPYKDRINRAKQTTIAKLKRPYLFKNLSQLATSRRRKWKAYSVKYLLNLGFSPLTFVVYKKLF